VPRLDGVVVLDKRQGGHWRRLWWKTVGRYWTAIADTRRSAVTWLVPAGRRYIMGYQRAAMHKVVQASAMVGAKPPLAPQVWLSAQQLEAARELIPTARPCRAGADGELGRQAMAGRALRGAGRAPAGQAVPWPRAHRRVRRTGRAAWRRCRCRSGGARALDRSRRRLISHRRRLPARSFSSATIRPMHPPRWRVDVSLFGPSREEHYGP
jgi:hypothetical protein